MAKQKKASVVVVVVKEKAFPMRKADKPMWQNAFASLRKAVSVPLQPRAIMDHEVKKPGGYTGI